MHSSPSQAVKGRLLVVDDDPGARQTLSALLSREGYETRCAADGRTALMFAEADPPGLILLDVRLPDLDGFEVCRRLKGSERTGRIPVVFLSSLDDPGDKIRGFESGAVDYITKPFQAGEVLARVETHLALQRLRTQAETQSIVLEAMVQERTRELTDLTESLVREIVQREKADEALEERLRFESLLSDFSARIVNVPSERLDGEIENALKMIREFFQVERCGIFQIMLPRQTWIITHAAIAEHVPAPPMNQELPVSLFPYTYGKLVQEQKTFLFSSPDDLPPEADVDRQTSIEWGIRSGLYIPVVIEGPVAHIIAIDSVMNERFWPEEIIPRLRLLGDIIVNALRRRNAEQALRESEERLDLAAKSAEAGAWVMNVDTGSIWATDKLRELFRFEPDEELNFESFMDRIHPDDRDPVRESIRQSMKAWELLHVEYRIVHPDGSIRWIVARGRSYPGGDGLPERLMGVSNDVTQRKMMELQLSESRTLLSSLINSTSDMIWSVDSKRFGLLTFNRGLSEYFLKQLGIHLQIGMSPEDLFPAGEFVQTWRNFYQRALKEGSFTTEYLVYAGSRTLLLNVNRLEREGAVFGVSVFGKDVTDAKAMESRLRESEERLSLAAASADARLWEVNLDTGVIWVTERGRKFYRLEAGEEMSFTKFLGLVYPEDRERVRTSLEDAKSGQDVSIEYRVEVTPGDLRWVNARGRLALDATGKQKRIMGVSIDITSRKRMENELQQRLEEIEELKSLLEKENLYLREELSQGQGFEKIVGSSDALNYVLFRVGQVAPTDATVLILGETGTGKGMVANAIHGLSGRKDRPMITVNCAALPANLIESELFGREKGAFTGAHARQAGRFEVADKGTIFLDEIGELPLELQSKLLRVLQDGEFERLGSAKTVKVDVRVIASTSRDLREEVRAGRFREDLFYRLNVFPVSIPPLRKRLDDIPQLVRFFSDKYARMMGRKIDTISKSAMKSLQDYSWPGNVRELEHVIERAVITTTGPVLQIADRLEPITDSNETDASLKDMAAMEREHILRILNETGWKIEGTKGAASILNLHPSTLRFRIKKLGLKRP
ncbi:MAG TPA: sigma 54-interacting transcriptional regulator [Syntrophales bacterium]|nr:sigma 54-interacting transcriptional regulator [Syntrophales bacterium]